MSEGFDLSDQIFIEMVVSGMGNEGKLVTGLKFIVTNLACSCFQLFVLFVLVIVQFFLLFSSGQLIWLSSGNAQLGLNIAPFISYGIVFCAFAVIWYIFWMVMSSIGTVRWFYWKVSFATLPIVCGLLMFNPKPVPMAMIPLSATETKLQFSVLVTGVVLFPLYSIGVYKFVCLRKKHAVRYTLYVCFAMIVVGSLLFFLSWNTMNRIY